MKRGDEAVVVEDLIELRQAAARVGVVEVEEEGTPVAVTPAVLGGEVDLVVQGQGQWVLVVQYAQASRHSWWWWWFWWWR